MVLSAFSGRVVAVEESAAKIWGQLRAFSDREVWDLSVAAVARANGMAVVSRNVQNLVGKGARVLNPFKDPPKIVEPGRPRRLRGRRPRSVVRQRRY